MSTRSVPAYWAPTESSTVDFAVWLSTRVATTNATAMTIAVIEAISRPALARTWARRTWFTVSHPARGARR
ncbi:hypothetical protein ACFQX8_20485 [Klenkia terrae]|uniref:hypothetical protein n=1 Tax=Klenkia terrae TaxID=1052259 RepID=UPI0036078FD0